jgi:enoyl-CoA hydratase/carnithine racemase
VSTRSSPHGSVRTTARALDRCQFTDFEENPVSDWTLSQHGAIALLTLTRPPRNFMSLAAMGELGERLLELGERADVAVVVLTGGLDGYFVAHADPEDLKRLGHRDTVEGDPRSWYRTLGTIERMPQPVVAAINGQCWGGGFELALACTLRIAARSATLALPEVAGGLIPGAGGTQRLPRLIGPGRAADLILSGREVPAEEAATMGVIEAVLDDVDFLAAALDWTRDIASRPRAALVAAKRAMVEGLRLPLRDGLRLESQLFVERQTDPTALALQDAIHARYRETPADVPVPLSELG